MYMYTYKWYRMLVQLLVTLKSNGKDGDKDTANNTVVVLHSLLFTQACDESSLYMTPYSSRIFSHPIGVVVIGAIGLLLFFLSIASVIV